MRLNTVGWVILVGLVGVNAYQGYKAVVNRGGFTVSKALSTTLIGSGGSYTPLIVDGAAMAAILLFGRK